MQAGTAKSVLNLLLHPRWPRDPSHAENTGASSTVETLAQRPLTCRGRARPAISRRVRNDALSRVQHQRRRARRPDPVA